MFRSAAGNPLTKAVAILIISSPPKEKDLGHPELSRSPLGACSFPKTHVGGTQKVSEKWQNTLLQSKSTLLLQRGTLESLCPFPKGCVTGPWISHHFVAEKKDRKKIQEKG